MVKLTAKFSFMELKKIHISDIGKVVTGKTPRTSIVENYGGDIPFLTPSDDLSYKSVPKTGKTLTEQGLNEVKNCLLPPHSVCVSCIGTDLGKSKKGRQKILYFCGRILLAVSEVLYGY